MIVQHVQCKLVRDQKNLPAKCPAVIDSPTASGTDPLMSDRRSSQTPCTTNTNKNVMSASMMTPWNWLTSGPKPDTPKVLIVLGVAS